eukprot:5761240-Lingulodinium_polyedra.AAC.1
MRKLKKNARDYGDMLAYLSRCKPASSAECTGVLKWATTLKPGCKRRQLPAALKVLVWIERPVQLYKRLWILPGGCWPLGALQETMDSSWGFLGALASTDCLALPAWRLELYKTKRMHLKAAKEWLTMVITKLWRGRGAG